MSGFYGKRSVLASLRKHLRTGKVVAVVLSRRVAPESFEDYSWRYAYVAPTRRDTGIGATPGDFTREAVITLWRVGEQVAPTIDDLIRYDGRSHVIVSVTTRLNADESQGYAVYDCEVRY